MSDEKTNIPLSGINSIGDDAYFIRLTDNKNHFAHPDPSLETKDEVGYRIDKGCVGAAIFKKENGENFIKESGANNLELVSVKEILGNDNSKN